MFLDLHTTSLAWSQALGLGLGEQQPAPGATTASTSTTRATTSDGGITKPLITWHVVRPFTRNTDDKLLGGIWRALGFTTDERGCPAGEGDGDGNDGKEKAASVVWDSVCVETALLAGLGWVWPYREPPHPFRIVTHEDRQPCATKWLHQAKRFLQRVPPSCCAFVRVVLCLCRVCVCDCSRLTLATMVVCVRLRKLCLMRPMASSSTTSTRSWYHPKPLMLNAFCQFALFLAPVQ